MVRRDLTEDEVYYVRSMRIYSSHHRLGEDHAKEGEAREAISETKSRNNFSESLKSQFVAAGGGLARKENSRRVAREH